MSSQTLVILGIMVAIVVPFIVYALQRERRRLGYEILENQPILTRDIGSVSQSLRVFYGDRQLENPHYVRVRIFGLGSHSISRSRADVPITVWCTERQPVMVSVAKESFEEIVKDITPSRIGKGTEIHVAFLRPKDWFTVQLITDGDPGDVVVFARFEDKVSIRRRNSSIGTGSAFFRAASMGVLTGGLVLLSAVWVGTQDRTAPWDEESINSMIVMVSTIGAIIGIALVGSILPSIFRMRSRLKRRYSRWQSGRKDRA